MIKKLLVAAAVMLTASVANANTTITGAGATFPYPIYSKWANEYSKVTNINLNYQAIGSGGGIRQIENKTVDFGASDMPLKPEVLEQNGLMQFPTVVGGDVPVYNIPSIGPGKIRFTGKVLADIFMGKITMWDAPALRNLNPTIMLPHMPIAVVHRSDGSGTTFIWTNYLSKVSPEWKSSIGSSTSVAWPVGVGGKGNQGVANYVNRIVGSIGYVEYAYVLQSGMSYGLVQNAAGKFVSPNREAFQAAAAAADWAAAPGMYLILTDAPGDKSWPIAGATFILLHKVQDNPAQCREVLKFFSWAYKNGGQMAINLDYVPLPDNVVSLIRQTWIEKLSDASGHPVVSSSN